MIAHSLRLGFRVSLAILIVADLSAAWAQVYRHVDEKGNVTYSNAPVDPGYELRFGKAGKSVRRSHRPRSSGTTARSPSGGRDMDEEVFTYDYDDGGRLQRATRGDSVTTYEYDDHNNISRRTRDGHRREYEYDDDNRLLRMREE